MVQALRLRVTLRDVDPAVWRVLHIAPSTTLGQLHELLQTAMGWDDYHLHAFDIDGVLHGVPDEVVSVDEADVRVATLPRAFTYLYDWGDGWQHDVEVLGPVSGETVPAVVDGARACPPEDCGGAPGYEHLLGVLRNPRDPEHAELVRWTGPFDPDAFDATATTTLLQLTAGTAPARHLSVVPDGAVAQVVVPPSVRLLLDLLADGVRLTPGGRLPRVVVRVVQEQRPDWAWMPGRPANVEEDLRPLLQLHELLRATRLVRLAKGVLAPTKAARADVEVVHRLRAELFGEDAHGLLRRFLLDRLAAVGTVPKEVMADAASRTVLRGFGFGNRPLTNWDAAGLVSDAGQLLVGLDAIEWSGPLLAATWRITDTGRALLGP